jgi:hypothetical protein
MESSRVAENTLWDIPLFLLFDHDLLLAMKQSTNSSQLRLRLSQTQ